MTHAYPPRPMMRVDRFHGRTVEGAMRRSGESCGTLQSRAPRSTRRTDAGSRPVLLREGRVVSSCPGAATLAASLACLLPGADGVAIPDGRVSECLMRLWRNVAGHVQRPVFPGDAHQVGALLRREKVRRLGHRYLVHRPHPFETSPAAHPFSTGEDGQRGQNGRISPGEVTANTRAHAGRAPNGLVPPQIRNHRSCLDNAWLDVDSLVLSTPGD